MSNEQARQLFYIQIEAITMTRQYVKAIEGEASLQSDQIQQSNSITRSKIARLDFWKLMLWILDGMQGGQLACG